MGKSPPLKSGGASCQQQQIAPTSAPYAPSEHRRRRGHVSLTRGACLGENLGYSGVGHLEQLWLPFQWVGLPRINACPKAIPLASRRLRDRPVPASLPVCL